MIYNKYKRISCLAILFLMFTAAACKDDPYTAAIKGSADVSAAVAAATPVIASYYNTGKINDEQKAKVGNFLLNITQANQKFRSGAVSLHNSGTKTASPYLSLAVDFVNSVPTDPTAYFYFSKDTQDEFNAVLLAVKAAVNGVALAVENAKGGAGGTTVMTTKGGAPR